MVKTKVKIVLGISSLPGGGKDYIADLLTKYYGFYKVAPGDIIRAIIKKMGTKLTFDKEQKLQANLRKKYGNNYIMELCYRKMIKSGKQKIVIPGVRFPADVLFYRRKFGSNFLNIFVFASKKTRYLREKNRGRGDDTVSYAEFIRRDDQQISTYNLKKTREISDVFMKNQGKSTAQLKVELKKTLNKFD
jgi:dephospho-CoA kinase